MREILVKFFIDWEDYDDIIDELVIADALSDNIADGVSYQVLPSISNSKESEEDIWIKLNWKMKY